MTRRLSFNTLWIFWRKTL